jgi:hypothetical protein
MEAEAIRLVVLIKFFNCSIYGNNSISDYKENTMVSLFINQDFCDNEPTHSKHKKIFVSLDKVDVERGQRVVQRSLASQSPAIQVVQDIKENPIIFKI